MHSTFMYQGYYYIFFFTWFLFMCRELVLTVAGIVMVKGELAEGVEQDSWTWTLDKGRLGVLLSKTSPGSRL
jgi:hypothetical protein